MDEVDYFHVELHQHDVLLAEGPPTESHLEVGDRANFANAGETMRLFPDFSAGPPDYAACWEMNGRAPLIVTGPALDSVRQRLNIHAALGEQRAAARSAA